MCNKTVITTTNKNATTYPYSCFCYTAKNACRITIRSQAGKALQQSQAIWPQLHFWHSEGEKGQQADSNLASQNCPKTFPRHVLLLNTAVASLDSCWPLWAEWTKMDSQKGEEYIANTAPWYVASFTCSQLSLALSIKCEYLSCWLLTTTRDSISYWLIGWYMGWGCAGVGGGQQSTRNTFTLAAYISQSGQSVNPSCFRNVLSIQRHDCRY